MKHSLAVLCLLLASLFAAVPANADSIVLTSSSASTYTYGLQLNAGESVTFLQGQTITLTGLFGVTGLTDLGDVGFTDTFTSDSVTLTQTEFSLSSSFQNGTDTSFTFPFFTISSSSTTVGAVSYSIVASPGSASGSVEGPVPPSVPEPSSLFLFGTGLIGVVEAGRRRLRL